MNLVQITGHIYYLWEEKTQKKQSAKLLNVEIEIYKYSMSVTNSIKSLYVYCLFVSKL